MSELLLADFREFCVPRCSAELCRLVDCRGKYFIIIKTLHYIHTAFSWLVGCLFFVGCSGLNRSGSHCFKSFLFGGFVFKDTSQWRRQR